MKGSAWMSIRIALVCACAAMALGQETIRPTRSEMQSFFTMTRVEFDARLASWKMYYIMDEDREKLKTEWATSRPAEASYIYQCGPGARQQQQTAKDFAGYVDAYAYWAFSFTSDDKPAEKELLWGGFDNPWINHARKMRQLVSPTPIVADLLGDVDHYNRQRPAMLEEVQWQFIAALGCGYRGVLWPLYWKGTAWGDNLKQIENRIQRYGRFLAQAQPVDWAKAAKDQPISASACEAYVFVFLLNGAYMTLGAHGKTVTPLEKPLCEGTVTLTLPEGLKVRRGQTLLGGKALRLASEDCKTTAEYGFKTGGEMLIFTLSGKVVPAITTQGTTRPATAGMGFTEIEQ